MFLQFSQKQYVSSVTHWDAWSFTSLMNMKTISNKCHSCLKCQIGTHLNTPGSRCPRCCQYSYLPVRKYMQPHMGAAHYNQCRVQSETLGICALLNGTKASCWKDGVRHQCLAQTSTVLYCMQLCVKLKKHYTSHDAIVHYTIISLEISS